MEQRNFKVIKDVQSYCIYEGDEFETEYNIETAILKITKFNPKFENMDNTKIKGAFAVVLGESGPIHTEIMSINQIKSSKLIDKDNVIEKQIKVIDVAAKAIESKQSSQGPGF